MDNNDPFIADVAGTKTIAVTASSVATALAAGSRSRAVIYNAGSYTVFIEWGTGATAAAVASGYPVGPGQKEVVRLPDGTTHVACISSTAGSTFYVTTGAGV